MTRSEYDFIMIAHEINVIFNHIRGDHKPPIAKSYTEFNDHLTWIRMMGFYEGWAIVKA